MEVCEKSDVGNGFMEIWEKSEHVPPDALKKIEAGRLRGKSDINPTWRHEKLTELFGPCGIGWKYKIIRVWTEPGSENQVFCFAEIELSYKYEGEWSAPIPGYGGSMQVVQEKNGLYSNDECYKMAITDAMSVAAKALGVGAAVYRGRWDGEKYADPKMNRAKIEKKSPEPPSNATFQQVRAIKNVAKIFDANLEENDISALCKWYRKGDKLSFTEASELISNFQDTWHKFCDSQNAEGQDDGTESDNMQKV